MRRGCVECFYWNPLVSGAISGDCRVYPPRMRGDVDRSPALTLGAAIQATWPVTGSGNWCGGFLASGGWPAGWRGEVPVSG